MLLFVTISVGSSALWAANVDVKGIKNDKILTNVNAHIDSIEPPVATYQFEQYQLQLVEKVKLAVEVYGYYQSLIRVNLPDTKLKNSRWKIEVELGPVTTIKQLDIGLEGEGKQDPIIQQVLANLPLSANKPLHHADYESSKSKLQNVALSLGYFDFKFTEHSIKVFESSATATITLKMQTGQRFHFGELRFPEDQRAQSLVLESLPFSEGEPYEANKLSILNQRLKQTQYFQHVLVRPLVKDAEDYAVPIEIILTHKPRDNFDLGAGFSSDIGPRFTAKWQRPWVNSLGHSMGTELFISGPEQSISLDYRVPIEDPVKNYASFQVGFQSQDDNDTNSKRYTMSATRYWTVPDSDWQRAVFLRLEQETFTQGLDDEETTRLLTPGFTLSRLRTKGGLDVYWGDKQTLTVEGAADALFSDINLLRITAQTKWLRSWDEHRVLLRADLGAIETSDFDQVPSSLRYFAGGDQSIRGFGYRDLSPFVLDENNNTELTGGRYLAVGSAEYSYPVAENWRLALFVDAGTATNDFSGDYATGIGAGVNWLSPVGPVRMYLGWGNSSYESTTRLHFSMGPAL
ncbi:autotransporter assembly complex protein TamA [Flavobacterium sp. W21_SRS_FM6]|uniref:autotransporter assembly complex protein TamA n=1 Tax=Flavobacterium sp. W21_SRS_FM6 TaxID=3240268 RepID=UPI003F91DB90